MSTRATISSAPGKRNAPRAVAISVLAVLALTISITASGSDASEALHGAARIVRPAHRSAPSLLSVVDQQDIQKRHRTLADRVLRALPSYCRDHLKNFYVRYDQPKNRGLGGETTIIVTGNVPDNEFMALVIHECGHVTDLGGLRGTEDAGTTAFYDGPTAMYANDPSVAFYEVSWTTSTTKRKGQKDADFVSGYAQNDAFEDFSETFAYYALQKKEFARLAEKGGVMKAKFEYMQWLFADTQNLSEGSHVRGKSAPWDVTKLPYVWHAKK